MLFTFLPIDYSAKHVFTKAGKGTQSADNVLFTNQGRIQENRCSNKRTSKPYDGCLVITN